MKTAKPPSNILLKCVICILAASVFILVVILSYRGTLIIKELFESGFYMVTNDLKCEWDEAGNSLVKSENASDKNGNVNKNMATTNQNMMPSSTTPDGINSQDTSYIQTATPTPTQTATPISQVVVSSNNLHCPTNAPFLISRANEIHTTYTEAEIEEARRKILEAMRRSQSQSSSGAPSIRFVDPEQLLRDVRQLMSIEDALKDCK